MKSLSAKGDLKWDPGAARKALLAQLAAGATTAAHEGSAIAIQRTPVGKGEKSRRKTASSHRSSSIELRPASDFSGRSADAKEARARIKVISKLGPRQLLSGDLAVSPKETHLFRLTKGSDRGESPASLGVQRGRLVGFRKVHEPGTLKKSHRVIPAEVVGTRVIAKFVNTASYAPFVEKGFHHKGGTEVQGQAFMRPAAEQIRAKWLSGEYFKR